MSVLSYKFASFNRLLTEYNIFACNIVIENGNVYAHDLQSRVVKYIFVVQTRYM